MTENKEAILLDGKTKLDLPDGQRKNAYVQKQLDVATQHSISIMNKYNTELNKTLQESIRKFIEPYEVLQESIRKSITEPYEAFLESIRKSIIKPYEAFQESYYKSISNSLNQISKILEDLSNDEEIHNHYRKLGSQSWVLPLKPSNLPDAETSPEQLNGEIRKLYSENEHEMLKWTVEQIKEHLTIPSQKQMLQEAENSYFSKNYNACSYTLAPLIEGVLSTLINEERWKNILDIFLTNVLKSISPWGFAYSIFCGVFLFLCNYMGYAPFSSPDNEPESLNRHWMLHGRTHKSCTEIHCLQLFGALWGILSITSMCEFDEVKPDNEIIESFKKATEAYIR